MAQSNKNLRASLLKDDLWVDVAGDQEVLGELPVEALFGSEIADRDHPIPEMTVSAYAADADSLEQLLRDAARESVRSSKATSHRSAPSSASRASPKSIPSPIFVEPPLFQYVDTATFVPIGNAPMPIGQSGKYELGLPCMTSADWVSNWSSRPEMQPPADWLARLRHPQPQPVGLPYEKAVPIVRRPPLGSTLLTHALMFVLGAATMFIFLKKYLRWAPADRRLLDVLAM